ncbi:MAG: bifunctional tRNA (5-methylaminomethyl-2-thiouridine)(34)-methyltransferase MnmD/FAD-dependent 5-carboxymethylaminomethyl-2-thiouridine(34) oxidoreductase MnmC [Halioglobus sp.]
MKRDNTPWCPVEAAVVDWNDNGDPTSTEFGDIYYSNSNGLEESRYVFLLGNNLPQRWLQHPRKRFCIAETGFGTGLNFLVTWQAWRQLPEPRPALHYLSIEKHPLAKEDLAQALDNWPVLAPLATSLLESYPALLPGQHRLVLEQGRITLDLWWEDATAALSDLASREQATVDAWYLDGFAPSRNASMWSPQVLQAAAALSLPGATFATFTAAGQVRRDMEDAGFAVQKVAGFARKRECLRGQINNKTEAPTAANPSIRCFAKHSTGTPWDIVGTSAASPETALVVGAGLAGCTVAEALARRGIAVTLLDQGKVASAGSGNEQGILYTRVSRKHSPLTDFALQSFRFASSFYRSLLQSGQLSAGLDGALCGSFHQSDNSQELAALAQVLVRVPELARVLDAQQAQQVLGIEQKSSGYWFPESGWMRPASVCQALADHRNITLVEDCGALSVETSDGAWQAMADNKVVASAASAIIATGTAAKDLQQLQWLPLQAIRGQTTLLPANQTFAGLQSALCHEGYIAPARQGYHCIGATFDLHDDDHSLRAEDHRINLAKLATAVPAWNQALGEIDPGQLAGRVGYRCASPDYLPMAGPVPDLAAFLDDYAPLRKNAKQRITRKGRYIPGLYVTTAHGSRGLTSTPLTAELLGSMICNEAPPFSRELSRAVAPARFIIRDLMRNRI